MKGAVKEGRKEAVKEGMEEGRKGETNLPEGE
jgi:hypothetical protein